MLANVILRAGLLLAIALGGSAIALHAMNAATASVASPLLQVLQ